MARMRRIAGTVAVGATLAGVLGGCSKDVTISYGPPVTTGARVASPTACTVLPDGALTAVLPQARDIKRTVQKITFLDPLPLPGRTASRPAVTGDACEIRLTLPNEYDHTGGVWFQVKLLIGVDEAAATGQFAQDRPKDGTAVGLAWGAQECVTTQSGSVASAICRNGRYVYDVSSGTPSGVGSDVEWRDNAVKPVVQSIAAALG